MVHVTDASQNPIVASKLLDSSTADEYINETAEEYKKLAKDYESSKSPLLSLAAARERGEENRLVGPAPEPATPIGEPVIVDFHLKDLIPQAWR